MLLQMIRTSSTLFHSKLNLTPKSPLFSNTYARSVWQEYVHYTKNEDGSIVYEDPNNAGLRLQRAEQREGINRRAFRYRRYEKPWMKRKRLKSEAPLKRQKDKVTGLLNWIVWRKARGLDVKEDEQK